MGWVSLVESQKSLKEDWLLWVLLGGALILVLVYYFIVSPSTSRQETPVWLFEGTDPASINSIKKYRGERVLFQVKRRSGGSGWVLEKPSDVELDSQSVNRWVETILSPNVRQRFRASPSADYGFDDTSARLTIVQNGNKHDLFFGGKPPTGGGSYLRYGDSPNAPVYLLGRNAKDSLNKTLYDIRDKNLFDRRFKSLKRMKLSTGEGSVTYALDGRNWKITQPREQSLNLNDTQTSTVQNTVRRVLSTTASTFFDTKPPASYRPIQSRVSFVFKDQTVELKIGGTLDNNRIVRRDNGTVVALSQDPAQLLNNLPRTPSGWPQGRETSAGKEKNFPRKPKGLKSGEEVTPSPD